MTVTLGLGTQGLFLCKYVFCPCVVFWVLPFPLCVFTFTVLDVLDTEQPLDAEVLWFGRQLQLIKPSPAMLITFWMSVLFSSAAELRSTLDDWVNPRKNGHVSQCCYTPLVWMPLVDICLCLVLAGIRSWAFIHWDGVTDQEHEGRMGAGATDRRTGCLGQLCTTSRTLALCGIQGNLTGATVTGDCIYFWDLCFTVNKLTVFASGVQCLGLLSTPFRDTYKGFFFMVSG